MFDFDGYYSGWNITNDMDLSSFNTGNSIWNSTPSFSGNLSSSNNITSGFGGSIPNLAL